MEWLKASMSIAKNAVAEPWRCLVGGRPLVALFASLRFLCQYLLLNSDQRPRQTGGTSLAFAADF